MKLLHAADIHIGNGRFGGPTRRFADAERVLQTLHGYVMEGDRDISLVVVSGDLFDNRRPSPREWALAFEWFTRIADVCPVVVTDGNHDGAAVIGDNDSRTLRPMSLMPHADLYVPTDGPAVLDLGKVIVVTMPYPHKRLLDATEDTRDMTTLERMELLASVVEEGIKAEHTMARVLQAKKHDPEVPIILVSHLTAVGALVGSERGMRLEDDISVGSNVLDLFDYCALGHIHKQQRVSRKAWYAGAPLNISWGEEGDTKGFLEVDVQPGLEPVVVSLPSGEGPLMTLKAGDAINEAHIRGTYFRIPQSEAHGWWAPEHLYEAGARYVEVVPDLLASAPASTSERALEAGTSTEQAIRFWLTHNDIGDPEPYLRVAKEIMEAT